MEVQESTGSTNAVLAERARTAAPAHVLVTEHQTQGRGRLARTWETPPRVALTFSVLVRPASAPAWPWLPLVTGVGVARALADHGVTAALKWPNDVLLDGLKIAGLLAELVPSADGLAAVVGIGLNVHQTPGELPVSTATSLHAAGVEVDRTELLLSLLRHLEATYAHWAAGELAALRSAYVDLCDTIGRDVRVELPDGTTAEGLASRVDPDGRLVVGDLIVAAGDIVHVRPRI